MGHYMSVSKGFWLRTEYILTIHLSLDFYNVKLQYVAHIPVAQGIT